MGRFIGDISVVVSVAYIESSNRVSPPRYRRPAPEARRWQAGRPAQLRRAYGNVNSPKATQTPLPCCKSPSAVNAGLLPMCREAYWADRPRARSARITSSIAANPQHSLTPDGQITPLIKVKYTRPPWKEPVPVPGVPVDIPKERWAAGGMGLRGGEVAAMTLVASHVVW